MSLREREDERLRADGKRVPLTLAVLVLGLLSAAPTPGDVGGCGTEVRLLSRDGYARARKVQDCQRCEACGLATARCQRACDPASPPETTFPASCRPLVHDGEVCLRARDAVSCTTFARYVDDASPASPTECAFCRDVTESSLDLSLAIEPSDASVDSSLDDATADPDPLGSFR